MKNRAFSLVEMVIATGIMVTLLVGLMSLYVYCFQLQDEAKDVNNVTQLMRQQMEQLKATSFATIVTNYNPPANGIGVGFIETPMTSIGLKGIVRVEVSYALDTNNNPVTSLLNIRVIAGWVQRRNGKIIGDGNINGGSYQFNATPANSPFILETAIVSRG